MDAFQRGGGNFGMTILLTSPLASSVIPTIESPDTNIYWKECVQRGNDLCTTDCMKTGHLTKPYGADENLSQLAMESALRVGTASTSRCGQAKVMREQNPWVTRGSYLWIVEFNRCVQVSRGNRPNSPTIRVGEELPETCMPSQLYFHKTQLNSVSIHCMLFKDSYLFCVCACGHGHV